MARSLAVLVCLAALLALPPAAAGAPLPGDEPSTAIAASVGTAQYDSTDMTANPAVDPAACGEFEGFSNTMWFSYTPAKSGQTLADVFSFVSEDGSTDFLAIVFVFAQHGSSRDLVACSAYPATVSFRAEAGTAYLIMSGGLGADDTGEPALSDRGGTFDLTITAIRGRVLTNRFHASDTFVDPELSDACGFDVTVSFDDRGADKTFFSSTGVHMTTGFINGQTTFTGNGHVVKFTYANGFRDRLDGLFTIVGLPLKVWLDGKLLSVDSGQLVLDQDGNPVVDRGHHPVFYEGVDICGLLGA
jgi:hypothetical protein